MKEFYMDEEQETLHIYVLREQKPPTIEAELIGEESQLPRNRWGLVYCSVIGGLFALIPLAAIVMASLLPPYDAVVSHSLSLTFSLHPTSHQVSLFRLPAFTGTGRTIVPTTGSQQEPATRAEGLITFYNGLFTSQAVPAGTVLTGKDGVSVVTSEPALIPAATPITPPTYGTVSVIAHSELPGTAGNIAARDIDRACCGLSILAQNLDAFSGGTDARTVRVVTQSDLTNATAHVRAELDQETNEQAQGELRMGQQLVSPGCTISTKASHQAGEQAKAVAITMASRCLPLAYLVASVQMQVTAILLRSLPYAYRLVRVSVILLDTREIDARRGAATLTFHYTAFLQMVHLRRSG